MLLPHFHPGRRNFPYLLGKIDLTPFPHKRDSIVVVAQLSPEFTARLVDRWRDLEETAVNIPKTLPEALRLAADLAEQKMQLENQLAIAAPKVEFADRVGEASGILIGNFAKVVGIGPNKLFAWMRDHKILIASGSRRNVPMQEYMDRGYFTVKETAVSKIAEKAGDSPAKFITEVNKLKSQSGGEIYNTIFSGKHMKELDALHEVLQQTARSDTANVVTQTGQSQANRIRTIGATATLGVSMGLEAGFGAMMRLYESKAARNALLRLANTKAGTPAYERALSNAANAIRPLLATEATQQ